MLEDDAYVDIAPGLEVCRIINGMWQVSGSHGYVDAASAPAAISEYVNNGFQTWDAADIYGPAESMIGEYQRRGSAGHLPERRPVFFTKFVPSPGPMDRERIKGAIARSCSRMETASIDLLQFHWWDYAHSAYRDALEHLQELRDQNVISNLGLTNFDADHADIISDWGIDIVSNQVQYSLIDQRPAQRMVEYCRRKNVRILAYGTLCGGLLTDRYLGVPEPPYNSLDTASLQKYKRMIDAWGGWKLFQELLKTCHVIAERHGCTIANVATRYILDRPCVAGVIIGARLGISDHMESNARTFGLRLDSQDIDAISQVTSRAADLYSLIGDCGDEYR